MNKEKLLEKTEAVETWVKAAYKDFPRLSWCLTGFIAGAFIVWIF